MSMQMIKDLNEKAHKALKDARAIHEKAAADGARALTDDEKAAYKTAMDARAAHLAGAIREKELLDTDKRTVKTDPPEDAKPREQRNTEEVKRDGFRAFLRNDERDMSPDDHKDFGEFRAATAQTAGVDAEGGYLVAPMQFVDDYIRDMDEEVYIRKYASKMKVRMAKSLGVPYLSQRPGKAAWSTEIRRPPERSVAFGRRELTPHPLTAEIDLSRTLLREAARNVEEIVRMEMVQIFAETQEEAFMTGDGGDMPLGLFVNSDRGGLNTDRDISQDNFFNNIDGFYKMLFKLKPSYRRRAVWLLHRDRMLDVSIIKDSDGRYMLQDAISAGDPMTIKGRPVLESTFAPATKAQNDYVALFGDLSYFWIADRLVMEIQRLAELEARNNLIVFIFRLETDGMAVKPEAFVRGKMG